MYRVKSNIPVSFKTGLNVKFFCSSHCVHEKFFIMTKNTLKIITLLCWNLKMKNSCRVKQNPYNAVYKYLRSLVNLDI